MSRDPPRGSDLNVKWSRAVPSLFVISPTRGLRSPLSNAQLRSASCVQPARRLLSPGPPVCVC